MLHGMERGMELMPSEKARLVLGYLKSEGFAKSYETFLSECIHLKEYVELLRNGKEYPTCVHGGITLHRILDDYMNIKHEEACTRDVDLTGLWTRFEQITKQLRKAQTSKNPMQNHCIKQRHRNREIFINRIVAPDNSAAAHFGRELFPTQNKGNYTSNYSIPTTTKSDRASSQNEHEQPDVVSDHASFVHIDEHVEMQESPKKPLCTQKGLEVEGSSCGLDNENKHNGDRDIVAVTTQGQHESGSQDPCKDISSDDHRTKDNSMRSSQKQTPRKNYSRCRKRKVVADGIDDIPHVLEELFSNTVIHEKLAENINKVKESKTQKQSNTKNPSTILNKSQSLDDFLNMENTLDAKEVSGIIEMTQNDPAFDALFNLFGADKNDFIDKEYVKTKETQDTRNEGDSSYMETVNSKDCLKDFDEGPKHTQADQPEGQTTCTYENTTQNQAYLEAKRNHVSDLTNVGVLRSSDPLNAVFTEMVQEPIETSHANISSTVASINSNTAPHITGQANVKTSGARESKEDKGTVNPTKCRDQEKRTRRGRYSGPVTVPVPANAQIKAGRKVMLSPMRTQQCFGYSTSVAGAGMSLTPMMTFNQMSFITQPEASSEPVIAPNGIRFWKPNICLDFPHSHTATRPPVVLVRDDQINKITSNVTKRLPRLLMKKPTELDHPSKCADDESSCRHADKLDNQIRHLTGKHVRRLQFSDTTHTKHTTLKKGNAELYARAPNKIRENTGEVSGGSECKLAVRPHTSITDVGMVVGGTPPKGATHSRTALDKHNTPSDESLISERNNNPASGKRQEQDVDVTNYDLSSQTISQNAIVLKDSFAFPRAAKPVFDINKTTNYCIQSSHNSQDSVGSANDSVSGDGLTTKATNCTAENSPICGKTVTENIPKATVMKRKLAPKQCTSKAKKLSKLDIDEFLSRVHNKM